MLNSRHGREVPNSPHPRDPADPRRAGLYRHGNDVSILLAKRGRCRLRDGTRELVWDGKRRVTTNLITHVREVATVGHGRDLAWYPTLGVHCLLVDPAEWALCCMFDPDPEALILGGAADFDLVDDSTVDASVFRTDGSSGVVARLYFGSKGSVQAIETERGMVGLDVALDPFRIPEEAFSLGPNPFVLTIEQARWIGREAPGLPLDSGGTLRNLRGSPILLEFSPGDDLAAKIVINDTLEREHPGLRVLTIAMGPTDGVRPRPDLVLRHAGSYVRTFHVDRDLTTILLDREGTVRVYRKRRGAEFDAGIRGELEAWVR